MSYDTVVITPYYEDIASSQFCAELAAVLNNNDRVIVVDDGSIDRIFNENELREHGLTGNVLRLKRNVGHQTAIAVGISFALEEYDFKQIVIMDSDGEDSPKSITKLTSTLESESTDIVVATRKSRVETWKFKLFYFLYRLLFRLLVGRNIGFGNFMALSRRAAQRLSVCYETRIHLAASVLSSKLQVTEHPIDRSARYAGKSQMNMVSLLLHGLRSVMVFAESVLVRITMFSIAFASLIITAMIVMILFKLSGLAIPGWFSTVGGILLLLLFQVAIMALLVLLLAGNLRSHSADSLKHDELIDEVINVN